MGMARAGAFCTGRLLARCGAGHPQGSLPPLLDTLRFQPEESTPCHASHAPGRQFSSSASSHAAGGSNSMSLWEALGMVLSPAQLGASALELTHTAVGLPWWVSIPVTTVAARAALLPLSLKAKQASANLQLLNYAFAQAKLLTLDMSPSDSQALGRMGLVRTMYRHLQARHHVPSMRWYWANAVAQSALFMTLTSGLGAMSAAVWPGFPTGGPPGLRDLTSPPVYLGTMSTPFGTMGAVMPLAIILTYVRTLDKSATAAIPGIGVALRVLAIPYYCLALIQPHATLLYWLTHTLTCSAIQSWPSVPTTAKTTATHPPEHPVQGTVAEAMEIQPESPMPLQPDPITHAASALAVPLPHIPPNPATPAHQAGNGHQVSPQATTPEALVLPIGSRNQNQLDPDLLLALGEHFSGLPASQRTLTAAVLCYGRAVRELQGELPQSAINNAGGKPGVGQDRAGSAGEDFPIDEHAVWVLSKARQGLLEAQNRASTWEQEKATEKNDC